MRPLRAARDAPRGAPALVAGIVERIWNDARDSPPVADVAHLLDSNASTTALTLVLNKTAHEITSLVG